MSKFLFEFFPIILFFATFKYGGIIFATKATILATIIQIIVLRVFTGKIPQMALISFLGIAILGGATIFLQNELFIKWKPTAVYWILAVCFLGSQFIGEKTLLQRMAGSSTKPSNTIKLSNKTWRTLNFTWVLFFAAMGAINLYVVYHFDTNAWANFKLFGTLGLTVIFLLCQALYMAKYAQFDK